MLNTNDSGTFLNLFPTTVNISEGPVSWNVSYAGWISTGYSAMYTTCTQYCCNTQTCTTTNQTCDSLGLPGTVVSGGFTLNPGIGSNCTGGQPITDELAFPCPCTALSNPNASCGHPIRVNSTGGCVINGDAYNNINGTCSARFGYINYGLDTITIPIGPDNNVTALDTNSIISYNPITTFLPGVHPDVMTVVYTCPLGYKGAGWIINSIQVFTNN